MNNLFLSLAHLPELKKKRIHSVEQMGLLTPDVKRQSKSTTEITFFLLWRVFFFSVTSRDSHSLSTYVSFYTRGTMLGGRQR